MKLPDKATLEYYLVDIGVEATKQLLHITDKQIDLIVYEDKIKPLKKEVYKEPKEYVPYQRLDSDTLLDVERVIIEKYEGLYKQFVKNKDKINTRSLTREDIFQDRIVQILRNSEGLTFSDNEQIIYYIRKCLGFVKKDYQRDCVADKAVDIEGIVDETDEDNISVFDNEEFIKTLNYNQQMVLALLQDGISQVDIATLMQMTKQNVYKIKNQIITKLHEYIIKYK